MTREPEIVSTFDDIRQRFLQMLEDGRHIFDASANALVGGTDPEAIRSDLFATDRRINETEQELRRHIVVHATVHGPTVFPSMLVLMSVAKDAERIGDYAKNIFDLCVAGPSLGDEREALTKLKDQISTLLVKTRNLHETQDEDAARAFLDETDRIENICDEGVKRLLRMGGINTASAALSYRYFKRVASHAANIVTALVVPLDKLDFFDEP